MLQGSDPGGNSLTYSVVDLPARGAVTLTNPLTGEFTYASNFNARGTDSFTFRVDNGRSSSDVATYRLVYIPRIMPLGDSITWGVTTPDDPPFDQRVGYRKRLRDALRAEGYRIDFVGTLKSGTDANYLPDDPEHEGHGGWSADQLVDGHPNPDPGTGSPNSTLSDWLDEQFPDVILLHVGTNDLNGASDPDVEWRDIDRILTTIATWESSHWPVTVVLSRIINTSPSTERTTRYNNSVIKNIAIPRISGGDEVIWVDHEDALNQPSHYADRLHPNATGYEQMANVWLYPLAGTGTSTGSHEGEGILPRCP